MPKLARFTNPLWDFDTPYYANDFFNFATGTDGVTSLVVDAGSSAAAGDARAGVLVLTTGATNNNEVAVKTTNENYLFLADTDTYGAAYIQYTEAATDDANVFVGFISALAADTLADDGAGPRASGSIACIYKVDGGTVWRCITRNGSASTDSVSTTTAGGAAYQKLEIECHEMDGSNMSVTFRVDGKLLKDSSGLVIKHLVAIASATEMNFGVYAKAGGANSEVVNVDWIYCHQRR